MSDIFDLKNKTALITGASSGIGKVIAEALGSHGATVLVCSNDTQGCDKVVSHFRAKKIIAFPITCDISKKTEIDKLIATAKDYVGKIDILVSCVGMANPGSFLDIMDADFERLIQLNLQSAIYLTQKILPQMVARKDGAIIYLSSIAAIRGNKNLGLYGISKAGLVQLARNLAVEYGPYNIRVNAISPGLIDTPFSESLLLQKEFIEKRLQLTPLRRIGTPEEIAGVALLLASKAGAFITGQNIVVDGGTTISGGN